MSEVHATYLTAGTREYKNANWALFAGAFVIFSSLYAVQPLLPAFVRIEHVHPAVASLSLSLSTAGMSIGLLVSGVLSESWGRKTLMVTSISAVSVLTLLSAFCTNFGWFLVLRTLAGLAVSGLPATAMAYLGEEVHPSQLGRAMGLYISGNSVGGMAGRIIVGLTAPFTSWHVAIGIIGVLGVLSTIWFIRALPPSRNFTPQPLQLRTMLEGFSLHLRRGRMLVLFLLGFLLMGGFVTLYNYMPFELEAPPYRLPDVWVTWIFLLYVVGTFSSTWLGALADKHGRKPVLWLGTGLMGAGLLLTLSSPLSLKIFAIAVFTFGFFGAHSIASGWVGRMAESHKGQASALYLFFYYVGSSIGGTLGGLFWIRSGWPGVVVEIGVLLLLSYAICAFLSFSNTKRNQPATP